MANKTKAELLEEIKTKNDEIKSLNNEIKKLERYKAYEDMANEMAATREAFVASGFSEAEAFDLTKTMMVNMIPMALKLR